MSLLNGIPVRLEAVAISGPAPAEHAAVAS
jgi:hypothetical protein